MKYKLKVIMHTRQRLGLCIFTIITVVMLMKLTNIFNHDRKVSIITTLLDNSNKESHSIYIAVVSCGHKFHETLMMIKSALIYKNYNDSLTFLIFTEDSLMESFKEKLNDWKVTLDFNFQLLKLNFPEPGKVEWRNLFKPCASQRLFLPSLLYSVDAILYVDADVLFISSASDIWKYFSKFNSTQMAALAPEHEDTNIGWYNRFARHPYYGNLGVNSGVMLMNLTRMRLFKWESHIIPIQKKYKLRITWGDQDIINIFFYFHPETLYLIPCNYNYRPDHCMYTNTCNVSVAGIKLIHGNRGYFHSNKQPLFRVIYECIQKFKLGVSTQRDLINSLSIEMHKDETIHTNCAKIVSIVLGL